MRLRVWINAFIPGHVAGYTQTISAGTHRGKTAVPLPGVARANPMNLFKSLDAGYLTDQRSFSSSATASHRMQSWVEFELSGTPRIVGKGHTSSGTTEVNMDTGAQLDFAYADMGRCSFSPLTMYQELAGRRCGATQYRVPLGGYAAVCYPSSVPPPHPLYRTHLTAAAGDPLVSAAADIDYTGMFELSLDPARPAKCTITFKGKIDEFPAFECYAKLNNVVKTLFHAPPPSGNTVTDLLGQAKRPIRGSASF
ncbi:MAG: hypothetical protein OEZ68_14505 [Gammaproteobacteria bacterium]|nr:hypothetical protein [Gammaproteobacteria bacterium]MDH5802014.1 hypothetical protein [Gammaproteobacteria bacterium]